jgi:hypothetical protein
MTLRLDTERWGQNEQDLRDLALNSPHPRTRERFLALLQISQGQTATDLAAATERYPHTIYGWVHLYNEQGPEALVFRRTGGHRPFVHRPSEPSASSSSKRPRTLPVPPKNEPPTRRPGRSSG